MNYDNEFRQQALALSDEIGVKKAAEQLGIPYYTLTTWRTQRTKYGADAYVGSGQSEVNKKSTTHISKLKRN